MANRKIIFLCLGVVLAIGAWFRFFSLTSTPPGLYPDEAMNGNNALEAISSGAGIYGLKMFYPENNGREGLFINLQAISIGIFGNQPWALRLVSAIFGTLTILGLFLLTRELFDKPEDKIRHSSFVIRHSDILALLSSFFLAVSYWHINFSRIGFRAIMVPFFSTLAMYFLLKGIRREKIWDFVWAGVFTGLGLHTYIAFRFLPFVMVVPIVWYLVKNDLKPITYNLKTKIWHIAILILTALIVFLPLGLYFLGHPEDFIGRGGQVSIFSAESPVKEFLKSNLLTAQMFFFRGDCNWRHNLACQPELNPIVAIFFLTGLVVTLKSLFAANATKNTTCHLSSGRVISGKLTYLVLLCWIIFLSLPATLTREGLPHTLRSIGMIPPVMILAGLGCWRILGKIDFWLEKQKEKWPIYKRQLERLNKEVVLLVLMVFLAIAYTTYRDYFIRWAYNPNTYFAFSADLWNLGKYLDSLPGGTHKYVIVNASGTEVHGIPMPAQTIMFATDTFFPSRNFVYYRGETSVIETIEVPPQQKVVIAFLNGSDIPLIKSFQKKFPELHVRVPGDFVILTNP